MSELTAFTSGIGVRGDQVSSMLACVLISFGDLADASTNGIVLQEEQMLSRLAPK